MRKTYAKKQSPFTTATFIKRKLKKFSKKKQDPMLAQFLLAEEEEYTFTLGASKILGKISAGILGYKGRKKGTPFVRERLGNELADFAKRLEITFCNVLFFAKIGKIFRFILTGMAKKKITIRRIRIKNHHAHGFLRKRKKRRV
jgi:ribosomal protein S11